MSYKNICPGDDPFRRHHLLRRHPRLPAHRVVPCCKRRQGPLPGQTLHIRHSMGQSGFYCEIAASTSSPPRRGGAAPRPHAGTLRAQPAHHAPAYSYRGPRPLRRGGFNGQDRASGHPSAALQPALHARRHGGLLRLAGPLDGLCHAVRHRTLLQRLYLALPLRTSPDTLHRNVHQEKMFGIFQEYQSWVGS